MIKGELVYLKLVEKQDLPRRVEWLNDPEINNTLIFDTPTSIARTEKWFERITIDMSRRDFSIFRFDNDDYIGFCGLRDIQMPVMKAGLYAAIGNRDCWGKGYGTEAIRLLMEHGFTELGLNRIYGHQLTHNLPSQRALKKLHWVIDGTLRQDAYSNGKRIDCYVVSILKEDWENEVVNQ